jgi:hypothetical protein
MITISFTITDIVNFPSPAIDLAGELEPDNRFSSVYGNLDFGFTVNFQVEDDMIGVLSIESVEVDSHPFYVNTNTVSNNSIRFEKNDQIPFPGEMFTYVSFDLEFNPTIQNLNPLEVDEEQSIIEWKRPAIKLLTDESYSFTINYLDGVGSPTSTTKTILQDVHWDFSSSLSNFQNSLSESKY